MATRSRKGQAALEFLTTYGWAVLIILVMIGAITYFGVLRPSKFLPSKCVVSTEFNCDDYQIQSNVARIQLKQGIGKSIIWNSAACVFDDPVAGRQNITATVTIG